MKGCTHQKNSNLCKAALSSVFDIAVEVESDSIYPSIVCHCCYLTLRQLLNAKQAGQFRGTDLVPQTWLPHANPCQLCQDAPKVSRGRPKKRKSRGRPIEEDIHRQSRMIMHHLSTLQTRKYADCTLHKSCFLTTSFLDDFSCQLCQSVPHQPLQVLDCQHFLCMSCIRSMCESGCKTVCPCNNRALSVNDICVPSNLLLKILDSLLVHCIKGCGEVMELQHLMQHIESKCTDIPVPPSSKITVEQLLELQLQESSSHLQTQTMGLLVQKLFPSNGAVTCRSSSGKVSVVIHKMQLKIMKLIFVPKPISLVRVTTPRVESSSASNRTLKRRSSELELVRDVVSKGSPVEQLLYELKTQTKEDREAILDTAMGDESITIPADQVLAMKADLSITWNKLRVMRR